MQPGVTLDILGKDATELAEFGALVIERNPLHRSFIQRAIEALTGDELAQLESYLVFCKARGLTAEQISDCYLTVVKDTLQEQLHFRRSGRYRHSRFEEVASAVYFDPGYMSKYMYGLAITSFLWPNHLQMFRFFQETLPVTKPGAYLEIGPGHGYFLLTALRSSAFERFFGLDISPTSIEQIRALLHHLAPDLAGRAELECCDFLSADLSASGYDAIVMGEVLEHVEEPRRFLDRIAALAKPSAHIFLTTCINAPAIDHIQLFEHPEQLDALFAESGLAVRRQLICPHEGTTLAQSLEKKLAINVAYVLGKA